jgi:hypothetical protein
MLSLFIIYFRPLCDSVGPHLLVETLLLIIYVTFFNGNICNFNLIVSTRTPRVTLVWSIAACTGAQTAKSIAKGGAASWTTLMRR